MQRPLPDNTQQSQETNIHASGGIRAHNPIIPSPERPQTHALDGAATGIGKKKETITLFNCVPVFFLAVEKAQWD
jgi:hypothetical protein